MTQYTSRQVARSLGITPATLSNYIKAGKVPEPKLARLGGITVQIWSERDLARARKLLPKIANGRKTRWQRQKEKEKKDTRAGVPVPHKKKPKKK